MDDIQQDIEEKSIEDLKKRKKPIKSTLKKCLVGVLVAGILITATPNIKYGIEKVRAKYDTSIANIVNSDNKVKEIENVYRQAVMKNQNMDENLKEKLIQSFVDQVIIPYGDYFTKETILNMVAIASTQKIKIIPEFVAKHSWFSGDYISFLNILGVDDTSYEVLLAHEELHAILKSGVFGSGMTSGIKGYSINEGLTASFVKDDEGYSEETIIAEMLRLILGNDNLIKYYLEGDLRGLTNELSTYIPRSRVNQLFFYLDLNIFSEYLETFLIRNSKNDTEVVSLDNQNKIQEKFDKKRLERTHIIQEIMKEIFEAKNNCKIEESKLGRIIFGKGSNYFDNDWNPDEPLYVINNLDNENIEIALMFLGLNPYEKTLTINLKELDKIDFDAIVDDFKAQYERMPKNDFFSK